MGGAQAQEIFCHWRVSWNNQASLISLRKLLKMLGIPIVFLFLLSTTNRGFHPPCLLWGMCFLKSSMRVSHLSALFYWVFHREHASPWNLLHETHNVMEGS